MVYEGYLNTFQRKWPEDKSKLLYSAEKQF